MQIDLNCDLGELAGEVDSALMPYITSANIACGVHAGDSATMSRTIALAKQHEVAVGAHPGYDDRANFGRREMQLDPDALANLLLYQLGAIRTLCEAQGVALTHVKPHGALYNQATRDAAMAATIARTIRRFDPHLALFGLAGSVMLTAGRTAGLRVAAEAFADRAYEADGSLRPRNLPGAVHTDPQIATRQALQIVYEGYIIAHDGSRVAVQADTLCVHGDNPNAQAVLAAVRAALEEAGAQVQPFGQPAIAIRKANQPLPVADDAA
jgi:5-oxoprolinase (ATP-hydrolysing) subunit A